MTSHESWCLSWQFHTLLVVITYIMYIYVFWKMLHYPHLARFLNRMILHSQWEYGLKYLVEVTWNFTTCRTSSRSKLENRVKFELLLTITDWCIEHSSITVDYDIKEGYSINRCIVLLVQCWNEWSQTSLTVTIIL